MKRCPEYHATFEALETPCRTFLASYARPGI
jgi:hypothetical protein